MVDTKSDVVEVEDPNTQRPWSVTDLVTDLSAYPHGYGILLNERLIFPEDLCLWRMKIDTTRQLFVDDYLIAHMRGLKRQHHGPEDHPANPVLTHFRGDGHSSAYGMYVCADEEHGYRMYYGGPGRYLYVAYSTDGINWDKPDLGIYDVSAEPDRFVGGPNNVVMSGTLWGMLHEPDDPDPSCRWKLLSIAPEPTTVTWPHVAAPPKERPAWRGGPKTPPPTEPPQPSRATLHDLYVSPDGLRWTHKCAISLPRGASGFKAPYQRPTGISDMLRIRWDPKLKKYIANTKHNISRDLRLSPVLDHSARVVAACESDDLIHWSSPRVYAYPDGEDAKMPGMYGIYEADGFPYESMWLNFFSMSWYHPASEQQSREQNLMPSRPYMKRNRIRLAASRDGRHWYYLGDRRPFIDLGPENSWKKHYLRMTNLVTVGGPLLVDDQLYFYYLGANGDGPKGNWEQGTGLAILRRDGFASLNATEQPGMVITRPLVFEGEGRLFVNADVAARGAVRVSVMEEDGRAIEGFGEDDCQPVSEDATRSQVTWSGNDALASLKNRYVRLAFHLQSAKLYAFWIE